MKERPALYALLGVLALGAIIYFVVPRGQSTATPAEPASSSATTTSAPTPTTTNVAPTAAPSETAHVDPGAAGSAGEPPLDYPVASIEAKPEEKLSPEETIKRKKHAIELLEDAVSRTQTQLDKANKSGDDAGVHTASTRLKRLQDVLAKRRAELADAG